MWRLAIGSWADLGLLIALFGLLLRSGTAVFIGLALTGVALWIGLATNIIRAEDVLDNWSVLIEHGRGRVREIFDNTLAYLKQSEVPNVAVDQRQLAPGFVRGLLGEVREFLVVSETKNPRLAPYQMFVNVRDYGVNLDVNWYLTYRLAPWQLVALYLLWFVPVPNPTQSLDLFDLQDLRAYVTNAHHCLLRAVQNLVLALEQDPEQIERRSRGFLGIS
jgi:hypothetical protein